MYVARWIPIVTASDDAAAAEDLDETFARLSRFRDLIALPRGLGGASKSWR